MLKRVVNCILESNNQILMLQKPKRGWWVVPGGKIESTETIHEAILREYKEETHLILKNPSLKGVFNIIIKDGDKLIEEWMMFTYYAHHYSGQLATYCDEGHLEWKNKNEIIHLPKAKGDNIYLNKIVLENKLITGKFIYTTNYELLTYSIDHELEPIHVY